MGGVFTIVVVLVVSIITVIGDYFIKLSTVNTIKSLVLGAFMTGIFFYILSAFGWFYIMKHMKLASLGVIYGAATAIILAIVGYFSFHESLNRYEMMGIFFGIISILLLSRFSS